MSISMLSKPTNAMIAVAANTNKLYKPATRPVALFFGGTSGIGEAMATQLAFQTSGRAHIVLLGRNEEAAENIISGFPTVEGD
jgi:NADP-dependent 3-hydroxy acid dehydrogenase YdfG